jgi:hypothetical protein
MKLQLSISEGKDGSFIKLFDTGLVTIGHVATTYEQMSLIELNFSGDRDIHWLYVWGLPPPAPRFNMTDLQFCGK